VTPGARVAFTAESCIGNPAMSASHFLRIEREAKNGSRHYVVHTLDPKFSMEIMPDGSAPDKIGKGVIKRILVPNSWAGDYGKYAKLMSAAQEFFTQSFSEPVAKAETRRFSV
jgi:hypothetical protein